MDGTSILPSKTSTLDASLGSPEPVLFGSTGLTRSADGFWPVGLLSGLRALDVNVSLVVTWTLSVLLSSKFLLVRCEPDGTLLWPVPETDAGGDCVRRGSCLSFLLPPCCDCDGGARGCAPLSCAVLRSARDDTLAWDEEDMLFTSGQGEWASLIQISRNHELWRIVNTIRFLCWYRRTCL